ncbi:thioredoxin domain-containing protein [Balneolaceae bacterium ANBcel3]|nr:thioredoxin domain-containing protein [Balneolaceae bacterium ANBcel3]
MNKEVLSWTATIALLGITFFIGIIVITDKFQGYPDPERIIPDWESLEIYSLDENTYDARITILEFFDYDCRHCKELHHNLKHIKNENPGTIRIKSVPYPLNEQGYGYDAAATAICIGLQNGTMTTMHETMFENPAIANNVEHDRFVQVFDRSNIDRKLLKQCLENGEYEVHLHTNISVARLLRISAVPAIIINGHLYYGALSKRVLSNIIENQL